MGSEMLLSPSISGGGWNRSVAFRHLARDHMFLSAFASAMILSQWARLLLRTVSFSCFLASALSGELLALSSRALCAALHSLVHHRALRLF